MLVIEHYISHAFLFHFSQGDGLTFPTRLVNADPEQAVVTLHPEPNKRWTVCVWGHQAMKKVFGLEREVTLFVCHVSSTAEVPVSPLSESQNRLLSNELHANNIGDHVANNTLKSGGLRQWRL